MADLEDSRGRVQKEGPEVKTLAAAMFPNCAFFPVSRFVLAFNTAATGTCMMEADGGCSTLLGPRCASK